MIGKKGSAFHSSQPSGILRAPRSGENAERPKKKVTFNLETGRNNSLADLSSLVDIVENGDAELDSVMGRPEECDTELDRLVPRPEEDGDSDSISSYESSESEGEYILDKIYYSARDIGETSEPLPVLSARNIAETSRSMSVEEISELGAAEDVEFPGFFDRSQLKLSSFEEGAMFKALGTAVTTFLLEQGGGEFAEFTKQLGRISEKFLGHLEEFANANSGGWRNKADNDEALSKLEKLSDECYELSADFINMKDALKQYTDTRSSACEIEDIEYSIENITRGVDALYDGVLERAGDFTPTAYSQVITEQDERLARSYLKSSDFSDLAAIESSLEKAEDAQKTRNIYLEQSFATEACNQLESVILNLKKSPKYRIHSLARRLLRIRGKSKINKLIDRLSTRVSLLDSQRDTLTVQRGKLKFAEEIIRGDLLDAVTEQMKECTNHLSSCLNPWAIGISSQDAAVVSEELAELDDRGKKLNRSLGEFGAGLVQLTDIRSRIAENKRVIENSVLLERNDADEREREYGKFCDVLRQCSQASSITNRAAIAIKEIAGQINGFTELGFPGSTEALHSVLADKYLDEDMLLPLEELNLVRTGFEEKEMKNDYLENVFGILDDPAVKSAMQKTELNSVKSIWSGLGYNLTNEPTETGVAITEDEEESVLACLTNIERFTRTDDNEGIQNNVDVLQDTLYSIKSRLRKDTYLRKDIEDLSRHLASMGASAKRSI